MLLPLPKTILSPSPHIFPWLTPIHPEQDPQVTHFILCKQCPLQLGNTRALKSKTGSSLTKEFAVFLFNVCVP